jgi:hypothetical protein
MTRRIVSRAALLSAALGAAVAGCNLLVGVGNYSAGSASDDSSFGSGDDGASSGDDSAATDGGPEGSTSAPDGATDGPTDALHAPSDGATGDSGDGAAPHTCALDPSLTQCAAANQSDYDAGVTGYSCTGSDTPPQDFANLACVPLASAPDGGGTFCCAPSSCTLDSTVTGCTTGWTGYSCTNVGTPAQSSPTPLACVPGSGGATSATPYCCGPSTCAVSAAVSCASDSTGYACSGSDTPSEAYPSLTCTATSNGYCCSPAPACASNGDCSEGSLCSIATATCQPTTGVVGDPCVTPQSDSFWPACAGGAVTCNGSWCATTSCTTDSDCGRNSAGVLNHCGSAGTGKSCFPSCNTNGDCSIYSNDTYDTFCIPADASTFVCSVSNGQIGDPCSYDSDCTVGTCGDSYACTQTCASASDTSCGTSSEGLTNLCVYDSFQSEYECTPSCATDTDCIPYYATSCMPVSGGMACE